MKLANSRSARVFGVMLISSALSGCFLWTSKNQGEEIRATAAEHERRLVALEDGQRAGREQLEQAIVRADQKISELQTVLQQATQVVTRNSADTGQQVQELATQLGTLEGTLAELRNDLSQTARQITQQRSEMDERIGQVARKAGVDMPLPADQIPAAKTDHYATAYRAYQASDYSRARALFREYINRYATDDNADNAQYWIGASYLAENRPATALGEFRKVLSDYSQGDAIDETLFDMAECFWRLKACTDAKTTLDALIRTQATSPLLNRARDRLREFQHPDRAYCAS